MSRDPAFTPVRTPFPVRGDAPGLLCRGMPVHWRDEETRYVVTWAAPACDDDPEGNWNVMAAPESEPCLGVLDAGPNFAVDWSDRAAIYLCLAWLADRGHVCLWMLPTTHGGRVEAWDRLTAWEVSAILVARSVGRVATGGIPLRMVARAFGVPTNVRMSIDNIGGATVVWNATEDDRDYFEAPRWCLDEHNDGTNLTPTHAGWIYARGDDHHTVRFGPEVGQAAVDRINAAALADGCALLSPGGVCLPDLGADHV